MTNGKGNVCIWVILCVACNYAMAWHVKSFYYTRKLTHEVPDNMRNLPKSPRRYFNIFIRRMLKVSVGWLEEVTSEITLISYKLITQHATNS